MYTLCALFISILSLFVSIRAMRSQQRHEKKSVQPIPQIIVGDYEDHVYVAIENAGIGPLIVNQFNVLNVKSGRLEHSIIKHMPDLPNNVCWSDFIGEIEGRAVPSQDRLMLVEFRESKHYQIDGLRAQIRLALKDLLITLNASDIYGDRQDPCIRRLDWFNRLTSDKEPKKR